MLLYFQISVSIPRELIIIRHVTTKWSK